MGRRRSTPAPRAVVTGGAGFIGSHLVDRLLADGIEVLIVDDLSTGRLANVPGAARVEAVDISEADLERLFRAWQPATVFHLAAQSSVVRSVQDPLRDLAINVVGTHRVAQAARDAGARRLVFASSGGAIYGETRRPATERTLPAPLSHYGVHKLAAEGHAQLAGIASAIARPSNVYGPRQSPGLEGAVVAAFVEQAAAGGTLTIHGDGTQTRDFVHVRDVTDALFRLGREETPVGTWNVASGRRTSIVALADTIEVLAGTRLERTWKPRRLGDITASSVSAVRLRSIGWRPATTLHAGIAELLGGES